MKVSYRSFVIGLAAASLLSFANISRSEVIKVDSFGAVADGVTNSHAAIGKALKEAAAKKEKVTVQFGPGRYLITPELPKAASPAKASAESEVQEGDLLAKQCDILCTPHCFELSGIQGLTIQGDPKGTELVITSPTADILRVAGGSNITVKDLVIDYDPLPFTQGTVIAIDHEAGTFDLDLDKGFPSLSEYWFAGADSKWGYAHDATGRFRFGAYSAVFSDSWDHIKDRVWRMHLHDKAQTKYLLTGDRFIHMARTNGKAAFFFDNCKNVSVQNVIMYSCSSSAVQLYKCDGELVVNGLIVCPRPGTGRLLSTNADTVHCQADRKGPIIENCIFMGLADDPLNFYAAASVVTKILAPNKVEVDNTQEFRKGDKAQIIEPKKGILKAHDLTVTDVQGRILTFDRQVPDLHVGQKGYMDSDTIYNLSACSAGFIVRNNILGGLRGRGIVVSGGSGIIENNLIKDTSGGGIVIGNEASWPQGPMTHNTIVRNNTIWGVGRDAMCKYHSAIDVHGLRSDNYPSQSRGVQCVMIENNMIINPPETVIKLQSVKDVTIRNNMVQILDERPGIEKYQGIVIKNCEDVDIERFIMTDTQKRIQQGIEIDPESKGVKAKNVVIDVKGRK